MATMSLGDAEPAPRSRPTVEPRPPPARGTTCSWSHVERGLEPGDAFDVGGVSGALASYLKRARGRRRAALPWCRPAALALAQHGFDRVVAVDIAPTVRAAQSFLEDEADGYDEDLGIYYPDQGLHED